MLLPETRFAGFEPPSSFVPKSVGHHQEWILACKTGSLTTCNFGYASALTETVLLGNVAYRSGCKLEWDASALRVKNSHRAMDFVRTEYRKGWTL
jgi:hypothetical protein